jgi:hypothetical protein
MYALYTSPEGDFIQGFCAPSFSLTYLMRPGMEFSTYDTMPLLQKFLILEHFKFQIMADQLV